MFGKVSFTNFNNNVLLGIKVIFFVQVVALLALVACVSAGISHVSSKQGGGGGGGHHKVIEFYVSSFSSIYGFYQKISYIDVPSL